MFKVSSTETPKPIKKFEEMSDRQIADKIEADSYKQQIDRDMQNEYAERSRQIRKRNKLDFSKKQKQNQESGDSKSNINSMARRGKESSQREPEEDVQLDTGKKQKGRENQQNARDDRRGDRNRGSFDYGQNGQTVESYGAKQKTEENLSHISKIDSEMALRQKEIENLKSQIESETKKKELEAELEKLKGLSAQVESGEKIENPEQQNQTITEAVKEILQEEITSENVSTSPEYESVLKQPEVQKGVIRKVTGWLNDHPRIRSMITGGVIGFGARSAAKVGLFAAYGANFPTAIVAGALGGGVVEAGKAIHDLSKTYNWSEIKKRFEKSDFVEKAGLIHEIEQLYLQEKFGKNEGYKQDYQEIRNVLARARFEMQTELDKRDGKFANYSEKDIVKYLLDTSRNSKNSLLDKNRTKEAQSLLRQVRQTLDIDMKRDYGSVFKRKKALVAGAVMKGAAYGAVGAFIGAKAVEAVGAGVDWLVGSKAEVAINSTTTTIDHGVETKFALANEFTHNLDGRGITGAARDSIHEYINQHMAVDPNFGKGLTIEQLVYAEDFLKDQALAHGISSNVDVLTFDAADISNALTKAGIEGHSGVLTEAGQHHIGELISHKPHFLSEATRASMLNFQPGAPVIPGIPAGVTAENIAELAKNYQPGFFAQSIEDFSSYAPVIAGGVVLAEGADYAAKRYSGPDDGIKFREGFFAEQDRLMEEKAQSVKLSTMSPLSESGVSVLDTTKNRDSSEGKRIDDQLEQKETISEDENSPTEEETPEAIEKEFLNLKFEAGDFNEEEQLNIQNFAKHFRSKRQALLRNRGVEQDIVLEFVKPEISGSSDMTVSEQEDKLVVLIPYTESLFESPDLVALKTAEARGQIFKYLTKKFDARLRDKGLVVNMNNAKQRHKIREAEEYSVYKEISEVVSQLSSEEIDRVKLRLKSVRVNSSKVVDYDRLELPLLKATKGANPEYIYTQPKDGETLSILKEFIALDASLEEASDTEFQKRNLMVLSDRSGGLDGVSLKKKELMRDELIKFLDSNPQLKHKYAGIPIILTGARNADKVGRAGVFINIDLDKGTLNSADALSKYFQSKLSAGLRKYQEDPENFAVRDHRWKVTPLVKRKKSVEQPESEKLASNKDGELVDPNVTRQKNEIILEPIGGSKPVKVVEQELSEQNEIEVNKSKEGSATEMEESFDWDVANSFLKDFKQEIPRTVIPKPMKDELALHYKDGIEFSSPESFKISEDIPDSIVYLYLQRELRDELAYAIKNKDTQQAELVMDTIEKLRELNPTTTVQSSENSGPEFDDLELRKLIREDIEKTSKRITSELEDMIARDFISKKNYQGMVDSFETLLATKETKGIDPNEINWIDIASKIKETSTRVAKKQKSFFTRQNGHILVPNKFKYAFVIEKMNKQMQELIKLGEADRASGVEKDLLEFRKEYLKSNS